MNGEKRRQEIINMLKGSTEPVSGTVLAKNFNVSRQVIVSDIALLKAANYDILSTYRGYILNHAGHKQRIFKVLHNTQQIADELYTIVNAGGRVIDVFINHKIYGELRAMLSIFSISDVDDFVDNLAKDKVSPLKQLTNDYHYHTVEADTEQILDIVEQELRNKKYLVE